MKITAQAPSVFFWFCVVPVMFSVYPQYLCPFPPNKRREFPTHDCFLGLSEVSDFENDSNKLFDSKWRWNQVLSGALKPLNRSRCPKMQELPKGFLGRIGEGESIEGACPCAKPFAATVAKKPWESQQSQGFPASHEWFPAIPGWSSLGVNPDAWNASFLLIIADYRHPIGWTNTIDHLTPLLFLTDGAVAYIPNDIQNDKWFLSRALLFLRSYSFSRCLVHH